MSGLAVRFCRDGRSVARHEIGAMLNATPYLGPDGQWIRLEGQVGFGYSKLTLSSEEEDEQQPLCSHYTGCLLVADVRLDNRADLFALLPNLPLTISDAELVLRLYEERGLDAFALLLGDFALAIWDPRERRMVCARDTSGQRPLYYRLDTAAFVAASEIPQLLQEPGVAVAANVERLRESLIPYHMFRNEKDNSDTYYQGIYSLPAGHLLVVTAGGHHLHKYWYLDSPREIRYRTNEEYAEHYRALFLDVLRARLRTSRPVGVLLSGGMDSSTVACGVQYLYRSGLAIDTDFATFTTDFGIADCDERTYIDDMQRMYGFDAHFVAAGHQNGRLHLDPRSFRESPNLGSAEMRDGILREVHQHGVRTLLTGELADACVGGSPLVFDSLLRQGKFRSLGHHMRAYRRLTTESLSKTILFGCVAPLLPLALHRCISVGYGRRKLTAQLPYLLPDWMPEPLQHDLAHRHMQVTLQAEQERRFANETRHSEYQMLYPPEVARPLSPWPMVVSRPFADRRLHQFLLAIPPEQKFEPQPECNEYYASSKQIVRRAMRGIIPDSIRTRTHKTIFDSVVQQEIERQWPHYVTAFGSGSTSRVADLGLIERDQFWARLQLMRTSGEQRDIHYVMRVVETETWLRSVEWYSQHKASMQVPNASDLHYSPVTLDER